MDIAGLKGRTIGFLRRYGHLNDPSARPEFSDADSPGFMDNLAAAYPWYREDPFHCQPQVSGDAVYAGAYRTVQCGMGTIYELDFEKMPLSRIPNSEEFVLVDIGSAFGRRTSRRLAKEKPNVKVYMIDKLDDWFMERFRGMECHASRPDVAGYELKAIIEPYEPLEQWANETFRRNWYDNVVFIHRELKPLTDGQTNLGDIENYLRTRRAVFTGFKNPAGLGNITAAEAARHNAEMLLYNNSSLENIPPDSPKWSAMRRFLGDSMSTAEIGKTISLVWDPFYDTNSEKRKYDCCKDEGQRMFTIALRQLFVLAQADFLQSHGMNPELHLNDHQSGHPDYNQPAHNIVARRQV